MTATERHSTNFAVFPFFSLGLSLKTFALLSFNRILKVIAMGVLTFDKFVTMQATK